MLTRVDAFRIVEDVENFDESIWEIYREMDVFISLASVIKINPDILVNIELIKSAESSVKALLNLIFIKMNPEVNLLITFDNSLQNSNYSRLTTRIDNLITAIEDRRETFVKNLSNLKDIETNRITNKANLDFFMSFLYGIVKNLVYNSLNSALVNFTFFKKEKSVLGFKFQEKDKPVVYPILSSDSEIFWYLVYLHFSRLSQITVSLFKFIQKEVAVRPYEISDISKLYYQGNPQQQSHHASQTPLSAQSSSSTASDKDESTEIEEIPEEQDDFSD